MKSQHRNEIDFCGPLEIYVDNLALWAFWVVQAWRWISTIFVVTIPRLTLRNSRV